MQVLVVNPPEQMLPDGTSGVLEDIGWAVTSADDYGAAIATAGSGTVDAVIVSAPTGVPGDRHQEHDFETLLRTIEAQRIAALVVADHIGQVSADANSLIETIDRRIPSAELRGRLSMIARFHTLLKRMDRELTSMQRLGRRLNDHFHEVDEEMRLAGRLQRDFLPDLQDPVRNIQFSAVYWPASWVSGDMFDVFRIDEDTTGFYVADVVGHGMSAGLLTMFIKRAVIPTAGNGDGRRVNSPSDTIAALNEALTDQELPNCQFVTACYGLINHKTLTLQYARGGHPYPAVLTSEGEIRELTTSGGLLGIFKGEEFPTAEVLLSVGDKVLFYTDGVELLFPDGTKNRQKAARKTGQLSGWHRAIQPLAKLSIQDLLARLESGLDVAPDAFDARDDVTILGLEVLHR